MFRNLILFILQVLSSYINPGDIVPTAETCDADNISYRDSGEICDLPPLFMDLLEQSCLNSALCSYLRNDSGKILIFFVIKILNAHFFYSVGHHTTHSTLSCHPSAPSSSVYFIATYSVADCQTGSRFKDVNRQFTVQHEIVRRHLCESFEVSFEKLILLENI